MNIAPILLFLDFGGGEIIIIFLVILIVLGPDKIPEFAKKAGQVLRYVRSATDDIKKEINKETDEIQKPFKSAYKSASAFSENANKAVKATLEEIELEEEDIKKTKPVEEKKDEKSSPKQ
jgi:sec-independent protein translocase protein TatB